MSVSLAAPPPDNNHAYLVDEQGDREVEEILNEIGIFGDNGSMDMDSLLAMNVVNAVPTSFVPVSPDHPEDGMNIPHPVSMSSSPATDSLPANFSVPNPMMITSNNNAPAPPKAAPRQYQRKSAPKSKAVKKPTVSRKRKISMTAAEREAELSPEEQLERRYVDRFLMDGW